MASIKDLKKYIKTITEDLKDECLISLAIHPETQLAGIAAIIREIDEIGTELIFRFNHCKSRPAELSAKQYINSSIAEADKKMSNLLEKMHDMTK
jgi:hypothetical protein